MPASEASSRHDLVLAAIPLVLVLGTGAAVVTSLSLMFGLAGGSLPATGMVGYALFVDPPDEGDSPAGRAPADGER
ncbi:hypothetical protein [Halomarina oriensis]|uniref:Uncharacterized protein n=1 Tax=Halomarina oriensis TaxID=671145 RepID=A0A6B0GGN3_9EURY|nr:hypothetical protein [Halomarina oriensis]MWG33700.1 hypothetical protein [Halomarina oriensis]